MTKQLEVEHRASQVQQTASQVEASLRAYVLCVLGRPEDLYAVQVRSLWQNHYRANVLVGLDASNVRVAHSYFLVTDKDGNLDSSEPEITGVYAGEALSARRVQG